MRKSLLLLIALFSITILKAGMIYVPANATDNAKSVTKSVSETLSQLDAKTFLTLTPAKIQEMTGQKMTFSQKLSLKITQKEVKKQLKKNGTVDMAAVAKESTGGISALWLILGLLLGLIGVIIALITKKEAGDNRVKSALIGWGIWIAIVLIAYVL